MSVAKVYKVTIDAIMPSLGYPGSAGFDVHCIQDATIPPFTTEALPTGLSIQPPEGTYIRMTSRSNCALKEGIMIPAGVIDPDFTGAFSIIVYNGSNKPLTIQRGKRIAQIIFEKFERPELQETFEPLPQTQRGSARFGSTNE